MLERLGRGLTFVVGSVVGGLVVRPLVNQLAVSPLVTQDLKLPERSLAGAGSGFEQ